MNQDWYTRLGRPSRGIAPMVDGSELPYRLLVRRYGVDIAWTPMYNTNNLASSVGGLAYLAEELRYGKDIDRPLVLQLSGNNPLKFRAVYEAIVASGAGDCFDIIELNMGCPQAIALRGKYGAYLMDNPQIAEQILYTLVEATAQAGYGHKVAVKTRLSTKPEDTLALCRRLCATGVAMFTLHGRTRTQRTGCVVGSPDWQALAAALAALRSEFPHIVFFANGGVWNMETHEHLCKLTGCNGTMAASMMTENAGVYVCHNGINTRVPDLVQLARDAGECWTDGDTMLEYFRTANLQPCSYVLDLSVKKYPLNAPLYADIIREWHTGTITESDGGAATATARIAEVSIEQRKIRVILALEYLLLSRSMPQFVTISQLISHVMRLVGRDLAAANVDLRHLFTLGCKQSSYRKAQKPSEEHHDIVHMCNVMMKGVCELYHRLDRGYCCLLFTPSDHSPSGVP